MFFWLVEVVVVNILILSNTEAGAGFGRDCCTCWFRMSEVWSEVLRVFM